MKMKMKMKIFIEVIVQNFNLLNLNRTFNKTPIHPATLKVDQADFFLQHDVIIGNC